MIRKMTLMPARHLGLAGRGCVRTGWAADLTVFDPEKIKDLATWTSPHTYSEGIAYVIVNGLPVVQGGEHTGLLPGRVLKKKAGGEVS
jgi:N-acyl-D-amino-acid deacylase